MEDKDRLRAGEQRAIIKAIVRDLRYAGLPPMDSRLRSILANEVGILRRGGWSLPTIYQAAKDLALAWDEVRGHNRLTHLVSRVRAMDADRERRAHIARMAAERQQTGEAIVVRLQHMGAPTTMPVLRGKPHPTTHDYVKGPHDECAVCEGPVGVHVRPRVDVGA